jgi:hypothetical protein
MAKEFYNDLIKYVSASDTANANSLLMREVGKSLAKDKSNFVELLTSNGVPANDSMSDLELIDGFVNNISDNKGLKISTAYMINKRNSFLSADGTEQLSDKGVKVSYKIMNDFFDNSDNTDEYQSADGERKSNFLPAAIGAVAGLGNTVLQGQQKKKYGATDALQKQAEARQQLVQSVMAQRKAEADAKQKQLESKSKMKKILLISGASLLGLGLIGFIVYKFKTK